MKYAEHHFTRHRRGRQQIRLGGSGHPEKSKQRDPQWLDSVLGESKEGVFTADFLSPNGTTVTVRDGGTALLDCRVYLRHDKTVGTCAACDRQVDERIFFYIKRISIMFGLLRTNGQFDAVRLGEG